MKILLKLVVFFWLSTIAYADQQSLPPKTTPDNEDYFQIYDTQNKSWGVAYSDLKAAIGSGSGSQTPWTSDITGAGYRLLNAGNIGIGSSSPLAALDTGSGKIISPSIKADKVFNVKKYGAKGDGITLFDGNITSGAATFTSASATFTSDDVGKVITIIGAGGTNISLTTTISAFTNSTTVTLSSNAAATVTNVVFTYGTDDTTAIRNTIATIAAASPVGGIAFFPEGIYIINGAFDQTNNSQIAMPTLLNTDTTAAQLNITLEGPFNPKNGSYYKRNLSGAIIYSTKAGINGDSIISGKNTLASGNFTDVQLNLKNLTFRTVENPFNSALNLAFINAATGENLLIDTAGLLLSEMVQPTHNGSYGLLMPGDLNNGTSSWKNIRTRGFYNGIGLGEHGKLDAGMILYSVNALVITTMTHAAWVGYLGTEGNVNNVVCGGAGTFSIEMLDIEHTGNPANGFNSTYDISDASSNCMGRITYDITGSGGAGALLLRNGGLNISHLAADGTTRNWRANASSNFFMTNVAASSSSGTLLNLGQDAGAAVTTGNRLGAISFVGAYDNLGDRVFAAQIGSRSEETFSSSAAGGYIYISTSPTGSSTPLERVRITNGGNVGIGTVAPVSLLDVNRKFIVQSGGNVGLGTISPSKKFEVNGGFRIVNAVSTNTVKSASNVACDTTCATSMCNTAFDTTAGVYTMVACSDATADICNCLGP